MAGLEYIIYGMDAYFVLVLTSSFIVVCFAFNGEKQPTKEEPFKFDVEAKKAATLPTCHWDYSYDVARSVIAGLCFAMGSFVLIFGYRRRRISFCFTGLTSSSILTYMVLVSEGKFSLLINILISLAVGLFTSLFTTSLLYCGCFITGLFAGFTIGFAFLLVYTSFGSLGSVGLPCVIVAGFGLVQVFITMWWRHRVYIVSSSIFAAAVMVSSIDYFVEGLFLFKYIEMKVFYNRVPDLCWWSYLMFGLWPALIIVGLLVQCLLTGKELQKHEYTFIHRRRQIVREMHAEFNRLL